MFKVKVVIAFVVLISTMSIACDQTTKKNINAKQMHKYHTTPTNINTKQMHKHHKLKKLEAHCNSVSYSDCQAPKPKKSGVETVLYSVRNCNGASSFPVSVRSHSKNGER